jgi:rubrerythrin
MRLTTASEVIRFATEVEKRNEDVYHLLGERYPDKRDAFARFAKQSKKNGIQVQRAYNEVVTDAIETAYSFDNLDVEEELGAMDIPEGMPLDEAIQQVVAVEQEVSAFYHSSAEMSKGLLADVPRMFERIVRKRKKRMDELHALA